MPGGPRLGTYIGVWTEHNDTIEPLSVGLVAGERERKTHIAKAT